jgi:hypothetical protein
VDGGTSTRCATLILSRLFIQKNMPALAVDKLKRLIGAANIVGEHRPLLQPGPAYEKLERRRSLATFRKI